MGAWIETYSSEGETKTGWSHPVWVRGLKRELDYLRPKFLSSHPVWVRGLKPGFTLREICLLRSHPVWVRGLKPKSLSRKSRPRSRTPCGCVD